MGRVKAKKSLGQHFLSDREIAKQIVDSLKADNSEIIFEIGPGEGALSRFLYEKYGEKVRFIEIDRESVNFLLDSFPDFEQYIIQQDFLSPGIDGLFKGRVALIGNLPYNISSQVFFKILKFGENIQEGVFMLQKEVAERIASKPGSKVYGILSVLIQAFYHVNFLFTVHEHVFRPKPRVKSAVIRIERNNRKQLVCDEKIFIQVVKNSFNQRRKMLRNSLQNYIKELSGLPPVFGRRPEQLSVNEFIDLTLFIQEHGLNSKNP